MSLLKKVKARLSQKVQASKEQRQRKQLNEAALQQELEEARWQGRKKGLLEQARKQSYQQAKTKPTGHNIFGTLGKVGTAANRGLDFLNQDDFFGPTAKTKEKKSKKKKKAKSSMFELF